MLPQIYTGELSDLINRRLAASFIFLALLSAPSMVRAESDFEAAEILFTQAVLAYDDGKFAEATRDLLKAHTLDPGNVNVVYYLGLTYNAQGNFNEAARYLSDGLRLQPKNLDLRYRSEERRVGKECRSRWS